MSTIKGKILRINPDGTIPNDNPFFNTATGQNRAIWALGLRNPYRFGVQPGTGKILINDVGNGSWEEIDLGVAGGLRLEPDRRPHERPTVPFAALRVSPPGSAGHGHRLRHRRRRLLQPDHGAVPVVLRRKYFFADYCKGWMRVLDPATGTASDFATNVVQPVDMQVGNDGALYYLNRLAGEVRRITFSSGNTAPSITSHPANVTVAVGQPASFSVSAEGTQPLTFQWQRNNVDILGETAATYVAVGCLADSGATFKAVVTNPISTAPSNSATLTVITDGLPGHHREGNITTPADGTTYRAGDTIAYAGTGKPIRKTGISRRKRSPGASIFHHDTHFHPFVSDTPGASGSFVIPPWARHRRMSGIASTSRSPTRKG